MMLRNMIRDIINIHKVGLISSIKQGMLSNNLPPPSRPYWYS